MSNHPVTREYDHEPAPGVQAHTKEVTQSSDDHYEHKQKTTFEGPGGTHGVATERTEVTVEHSGETAGTDGTDGKKHHSHHHSEHHSEHHSKGLLHKIGKIFSSDKKNENGEVSAGDAARLTKYEGQQQDTSDAALHSPGSVGGYSTTATNSVTGTPLLNNTIESESSSIVKQEIPTPKKGERVVDQYGMAETSSSSMATAGSAVKMTEQTTTKTISTVVGHVVEEREVHSDLSQRINEAKRIERREEENLSTGVDKIRIGALQRESSAPYARNVDVQKEDVNIDVRQGTQTSDIAVGPYVVERPGSHIVTDAAYKTTVTSLATGPSVVENQPQQSHLLSERNQTRQVDKGQYAESQAQQSTILNERMRTQDIARGDSTVENYPERSGHISEKVASSDVASGPYVVVSPGRESGVINEQYRTVSTGPSVVENQPQPSGLMNEHYATRQFASGPSVVENQPLQSNVISERDRTRDVDQGYILESQGAESGLLSERNRTRNVDHGQYAESQGQASGLLSEQYKTRDRATGPAIVENQPAESIALSERIRVVDRGQYAESQAAQSDLLSERHATSDIAAGPYVLVKEGEHAHVDASSREASAQYAGRDMYAVNERLQGVGRVTDKFENYEEHGIERAPLQIVKEAAVGTRVDQFEHEQTTNITKQVPEITVRRSVEDVVSELMTESPIQKTVVPDLHANVLGTAKYLEREESLVGTGLPEQIQIAKHAPLGQVLEELRENSATKVEKVVPPRLSTHVPERAHEFETSQETVVTSSPIELVKHASIGGVLEELRESATTYVEKTPAPLIESRVPQRAAEFAQQTQETVSVAKKPVVLGRRVDIEQIKESLATNKDEVVKTSEIPQVQSNVRESVNRYERSAPADLDQRGGYQREVSARGDVLGAVGKFSNRSEDVVTSKNVVDVSERGIVREQKNKFESGSAFTSADTSKTKLVVSSQPVEIAQIEVERTEHVKSKNGNLSQSTSSGAAGATSLVREDVTVKMNKNLEGLRVVPEKVVVQKEKTVTRTETTTINQQQQQQPRDVLIGSTTATSASSGGQVSKQESGSTTTTTSTSSSKKSGKQ